MATLQQRRKRNMIVLIAVLVAAAAVYLGISIYEQQKEKKARGIELTSCDAEDFDRITFRRKGEETVQLEKQDEVWINTNYPDVPVHQEKVAAMAEEFAGLLAKRKLSETNLADFGLEEPSIILEASSSAGESVKISFGDKNAADLGYYAVFNGGSEIYLMDKEVFDTFNYTEGQLIEVEKVREISPYTIRDFSWEQDNGTVLKLVYDDKTDVYSKWLIAEPYHSQVRVDTLQSNALIEKISSIVYTECIDYNCKDFSKYGFDDPALRIRITYMDSSNELQEYQMEFGDTDENGYYYVRTSDSNNVNLYNSTDAKAFLQLEPFKYLYKTIYYGDAGLIEEITLETESGSYHTSKGEDSFEEKKEALTALKIDGEAAAGTEAGREIGSITVDRGSYGKEVWSFYEYDGRSLYLLDLNGKDQSFVVTKKEVDSFMELMGQ